jgi:hypothetical protein
MEDNLKDTSTPRDPTRAGPGEQPHETPVETSAPKDPGTPAPAPEPLPENRPAPPIEKLLAIRESFRQAALDAYREEYKELTEVWKALETKAQGTITIGGIFIAAAFTFAKDLASTRLDYYGNLLLGAVIFLLIASVCFSILALKTREVSIPPGGESVEELANDLREVNDGDLFDRKRRFINDQSTLWKTSVSTTRTAIEDKERWLDLSQGFLTVAIVIAGALTLKLLRI